MNNKKFKKFECIKNNTHYIVEEDLVGWYLIIYNDKKTNESSADYLFDTLDEAMFEAKEKFNIPQNGWKEVLDNRKTSR